MRTANVIGSGVLACLAGLIGVFFLGMTGLVWYQGELRETTSFDSSEASIGYGVAYFFWAITLALVLVAIILAVQEAYQHPERRTSFLILAGIVPVACGVIIAIGWLVLLSPGSASFAL